MVLYYGLLALETANNTAAASTTTMTTAAATEKARALRKKQKHSSNTIGSMVSLPSSSSSPSSNSWIYTEDLRKRFEERYGDCRYVLVPVYIDRNSSRQSDSTMTIVGRQKSHPSIDHEHSWMYSRSIRDRLFYSTSKISLPYPPNVSSLSSSCVTNRGFMRDEHPTNGSKMKLKNPAKAKNTSAPNLSSSPFGLFSSAFFPSSLGKHRTSDVVEEEDDETADDEGHSVPLLKHGASPTVVPSSLSASRTTTSNNNANATNDLALSPPLIACRSPSLIKRAARNSNKLTRLRSFFFKSSSPSFSRTQSEEQASLSSSSLPNRIGKHE